MAKRKATVPELRRMKEQGKKIRMVTAYDYSTGVLVDQTDIELILVGDSLGMVVLGYEDTVSVTMEEMIHHSKAVVRGAKNTFIVTDLPFGAYHVSVSEAVHNAVRLMKEGRADAVKLEGGVEFAGTIEAIVRAGIPVMGHIGLTPQTASALGGFRVQGKDLESARRIFADAKAVEEAGAFAVVLEAVPAPLAKIITEELRIPTIGIGAGVHCDGQVLVYHDLLGLFDRFVPKFVKQYVRLDREVVKALQSFSDEVAAGAFPGPEHSFSGNEEELRRALGV